MIKKSSITTSLFALFSSARINLIGQLYGSEAFALLFFPYSKIKTIFENLPLLKKIGFSYLLLLLSLMFSDIVINGTPPANYLRGWANVSFSFFTVVFLAYQFQKKDNNIYYYLFFAAISFFIFGRELDMKEQAGNSNIFKIYFMTGINFLILLCASLSFKFDRKNPLLIFFAYSIFCLIFDSRSNGAIFFITGFVMLVKTYNIKLTKIRIFSISVILILIFSMSYVIYINNILNGNLTGDNTQQIRKLENPYNPIALLEVGRAEIFAAVAAINENPFFGYGSWAEDKSGKFIKMMAATLGNKDDLGENDIIPSHSVLLTAWLWAGIGGFLACLFIYYFISKMFFSIFKRKTTRYIYIITPLFFMEVWNFLFSPFGHLRYTAPLIFALIIVEYYKNENNGKKIPAN